MNNKRIPWLGLIALVLLALAVAGLVQLPAVQQQALLQSLESLLVWLPVLYGVVALSYAGRYWRWRLLLGKLRIGSTNWPDLLCWFRGFALTATPAKVGELSRVQLLHKQLGYPRLPLVHVFVAERCADAAAVGLLLLLLIPNQLLGSIPSLSSTWLLAVAVAVVAASALLLASRRSCRRWMQNQWHRFRHHFPSGALAQGLLPATLISVVVWANEALVLWLLVRLLAPAPITIPAAITIYLVSGTAGMASSLPGGIGVNEAATVLLLGQQGVPAAVALPVAMLRRLITLWSMATLAIVMGFHPLPINESDNLR
ncbi:lysylphosphatidylglycerol synthase transmembrane domain-containing protein [Synechococcus sp. M16.1]|uniref:lysylphosphatidylglycerol synthase transmembrane domain-containing protein n=1 Tax=Synechococcus sp. M16.1 TaxID=1442553 RepID=UPI0016449BFE|nr:lysylphosphatidylglycerol synthase transmembrane domain-containing protein [Synechococcus sp. M16.1]QNJ12252.1 TIGR00374 family protein [Synechococcus sp. M16.1]